MRKGDNILSLFYFLDKKEGRMIKRRKKR